MSMEAGKIFVGGLNHDTDKDSLKCHFSSYGEVTDCVVMLHPDGKSRGFGFVTFGDPDGVTAVLANQVHEIDGKVVDPKPCSARGSNNGPPKERGSRGDRPHYTGRTTKIFMGGLPNDATDESLKSFFSTYGKVVDVVIMRDQETQKPRGFGFLTFDSETAVDKAAQDHYVNCNGKQVEVKKAEPRQGGGGGGRRQNFNQEQGWGDGNSGGHGGQGGYQNQSYGGGYSQQGGNSYGGYGNQGFDPSWQSQNYNQQSWQGQGQYGNQGYNQQQYSGQQQPSYGSQGYSNGQSYGAGSTSYGGASAYGGYGAQGYNASYGGNQSYGQQSGGNQGYSGGQAYGGSSSDGYGGSSGGGGKSSGGGSQGYHPYKRSGM